jgi:hypothetical protein
MLVESPGRAFLAGAALAQLREVPLLHLGALEPLCTRAD